ncbi:efflux RND transporter permease subunit [Methylocystis echinoides]|uniref:Cation transporter n=1 Tax=Methylocystis echinoides TaxID=29468 RepID=A0A9W6GYE6_9HYPH|nr:CusA/CzcA family heavy metal efflux RND transporter [Methylocystis echinoides]RTL81589.1 MAG: efflux RND transporter permease subunit [Hyphomicrobiales bacterium]GLI95164.1 cation transporter [Methylocystis echinoides]
MIARIIEFSARNAFLILLMALAILGAGLWAIVKTPLDALPDVSDVQVIVATQWEDRSPNIIEDQITYPIVTQLLSTSHVKAVRASSFYGESLVYVIFEDGTDLYWARTRVLEYLSGMAGKLPQGVSPKLGPDATGVGWAMEYALVDKTGKRSLADLRTLQDWQVQYQLRAVSGVAEVAPIGGLVKQYQVTLDPDKLLAYKIPINKVVDQVRRSNQEVGGRVLEFTGREYMVRGRGYIQTPADIENIAVGAQPDGTPILVRDIGFVQIGPDIRRGVADLNGMGDVAGGIVVVRFGESVYGVLNRVKEAIETTVQPSLPEGVELVITYDRSELIAHSVKTLRDRLIEESVIVSLVCLVFLFHARSALVAIITLPLAVLMALVAMQWIGLTSNIMSLGGIAIAIGAMVDAAIVMIENAHKHIEREDAKPEAERLPRLEVIIAAGREVGPSLFFSLLIITVSFLPVFALQDQEGRMFKPLAYTKSFSMFFAAMLSITVTPFLMTVLIRGRVPPEESNPVNRFLIWLYRPVAQMALKFRYGMIILALLAIASIAPIYASLGSEFMPPLWEESLLFMPATLPGSSIQTMKQTIQEQDKILMGFPEVASVFAKAGRANSATDPAPLEMVETVINLKPADEWRAGMTPEKLIAEMNAAMKAEIPGFSNSWTMPIKARIDMLSTGIRTPIGVKVYGPKLSEISRILTEVEAAVNTVPGTRSAFAERVNQGYYLDFDINRAAIARYGLSVMDVQDVIVAAVGGSNLTQTIEGRQRFPVNVRYGRELRDDINKLRRVLVATPTDAQIPLEELADIRFVDGPTLIKSEAAQLVGYVYVDFAGRDMGSYLDDARKAVADMVKLPPGYRLEWSGSFEGMQRAGQMLKYVIPITLFLIAVLLYLNARSLPKVLIVMSAVPFSLVGAFLLLWALGYNLSVAVWVGIIALAGVDAETGMVMLLYLDVAYERSKRENRMNSLADLESAVMEGAVQRVRPKMMTVLAILMGLLPIMWGGGAGSDVMKRIAAPMVGGVITSFILELMIYPAIYVLWKWWAEVRRAAVRAPERV